MKSIQKLQIQRDNAQALTALVETGVQLEVSKKELARKQTEDRLMDQNDQMITLLQIIAIRLSKDENKPNNDSSASDENESSTPKSGQLKDQ